MSRRPPARLPTVRADDAVEVVAPAGALAAAAPRVRALLADGRSVVVRIPPGAADVAALDVLARLALCARRGSGRLRVEPECPDLRRLVELAGLTDVLAG